jgi:hypothetical protein
MMEQETKEEAMAEHCQQVTVCLRPSQLDDLRKLAEQEDRSLSQLLRVLVARGLRAEYEPVEE